MAEVRTESWAEFTHSVAEATKSGKEVQIVTGADISGVYVAVISEEEEEPWETHG